MTGFSRRELPATPDVAESQWDAIDRREALEYDAETETYLASFDRHSDSVRLAVVSAVAVVADTPPLELPPLYDEIDPGALEALTVPTPPSPSIDERRVSITFDGCDVTVHSRGIIAVQPPEASST